MGKDHRGLDGAGIREVFFAVRGSIIRVIAWKVVALTVLACGVVYWTKHHGNPLANFGPEPFTFIGISILVFMSFRNSACFDRWWEARKQWGHLIVCARSLARETLDVVPAQDRKQILAGVCAYARSLRTRLRGLDEASAARPWLLPDTDLPVGSNLTNHLLDQVGKQCSRLAVQRTISEWRYMLLETRLTELSQVQAACERISNTPLPFAYTLLIHRTTHLFCGLLPFGLATHLGWGTPILVAVVSYAFFGLDAIGDELEDPFGHSESDLPIDDIVETIERETGGTAEIVISQPFWPAYLTAERIARAKKLKLALTAGIGSDHVDLEAAARAHITVAEVTGSNSISVIIAFGKF